MFASATKQVRISQQVVATLAACATVLASIGYYNTVQAANLSTISNTLSTSEPGVGADHEIEFVVPTGSSIAPADTVTITFDSQDDGAGGQSFSNISSVVSGDVTVTPGGSFSSASADSIDVTGITAAAGATVTISVANEVITNPAKVNPAGVGDSYEIEVSIDNTTTDIGRTRVVIIDTVEVLAIVPTQFEFEVRPVATSTTVNGLATTGGSASTTIDFGELVADTPEFIAQQLAVTTNARNGFIVTVEQSGPLASANGADIDSFIDGTDVTTPTAWTAPDGTVGNGEDAWGHWGVTTEDGDTFSTGPDFTGTDEYIALLTTPQVIFGHNGPSDGTSTGAGTAADDDIGVTEVGYRIEISPLQEAADDYTTTLTYIATPTF